MSIGDRQLQHKMLNSTVQVSTTGLIFSFKQKRGSLTSVYYGYSDQSRWNIKFFLYYLLVIIPPPHIAISNVNFYVLNSVNTYLRYLFIKKHGNITMGLHNKNVDFNPRIEPLPDKQDY